MANNIATFYKEDGWFRLLPPKRDPYADYYFTDFQDMKKFSDVCGWILRKRRVRSASGKFSA